MLVLLSLMLSAGASSENVILEKQLANYKQAADLEIKALKLSIEDRDRLIARLQDQRDRSLDQVARDQDKWPWFFWVLVGGTAATILVRGVTK